MLIGRHMGTDGDRTARLAMIRKGAGLLVALLLLGGLLWLGLDPRRYLLFHVLVELFRIVVAMAIFLIAWNTRHYVQAGFVLVLGVGFFFVGAVDLLHTIAYKGMGILPASQGANLATQLWMAGRFIEAPTLLLAMLFTRRKPNSMGLLAGFATLTTLLLMSIFVWDIFPECFRDAQGPDHGLTFFKNASEWVVVAVMMGALGLLVWHRRHFERPVLGWLGAAIVAMMASEVAFTGYVGVYDMANQLGHIIKLVAFYFAYKALVETGLRRPYDLLFRDLQASRSRLARARDGLEQRVEQRTAELRGAVDNLMLEVKERLAAQKRLAESEERFRLIAETVQDAFWISTPGMENMLYISPAYEEIWGRSLESLYAHPESFMEAIHPEDRARMIVGQAYDANGEWDFEHRIVRLDGTTLWVRDRGYPICDAQGKLTGMAGAATDITARKLREEDLAESQSRLAKAQEIAQLGNWEWDIASNELWWSDQIYSIFGTTPDEFDATYGAFLSLVHPEDREAVVLAIKQSLGSRVPFGIDHRIVRQDGSERFVHQSGEVVRDADGKPIRMSGTIQDITQRKQIEDKLHESEQRYRELVELSPIGIMVSVQGEIVFVNSAAAAILGVSQPGELVGRNIENLVHADYSREVRDRLRRVREMRAELPLTEMRMSRADGTMVVVESASAFVMYQQEPAVQTVFRDVTERNRQKTLIEQERQRLFAVLNMLPGYVTLVGPDFSVRFANHRYLETFGDIGGRPCHMIQQGRDKPCEDCPLPRVFDENLALEYEWISPQGQTYRTWTYPFSDMDGSTVALTIGLDVTDRKALEKQVIDASEIERRNIGRDLHDSLGQELTGLGLLVESLVKDVTDISPEKAALGEQIIKLIRYAVSQVRLLSKGLDPVSFRGGGLAAGLRDLAEDVRKQSGVECEFRCTDGVSVEDEAAATHLYRIAQEAVNNAIKHADACLITICLTKDASGIHLTVTDDGQGLPDGVEDGKTGMGMRTMRYRASVLGGTLNVATDADGTRVTCFIPASRISQLEDAGPWAPKNQ